MAWTETPRELRRALRVRSKAWIRIHCDGRVIRGRVADLAVGGVRVSADIPLELVSRIGALVRVELEPDAAASRPFTLRGRMLRVNPATRHLAIGFELVSGDFADFVRDELVAAVTHDATPHMLLVDTSDKRRTTIANAFRKAGCDVTEASTPLEAIAHLGRSRFEPGLIAIADTVPEAIAEELRDFVLVEHPEAHMVVIGRLAAHRGTAASWLCSSNSFHDLETRVHRVIIAHGSRRRSVTSAWSSSRRRRRSSSFATT